MISKEEFARRDPFGFIKKYYVKLVPVLTPKMKDYFWTAGYRRLGAGGWHNYVPDNQCATGRTAEEALHNLAKIKRRKRPCIILPK